MSGCGESKPYMEGRIKMPDDERMVTNYCNQCQAYMMEIERLRAVMRDPPMSSFFDPYRDSSIRFVDSAKLATLAEPEELKQ